MVASQKGHLEVVKFLLQMKALINDQSKVAATILYKESIKIYYMYRGVGPP